MMLIFFSQISTRERAIIIWVTTFLIWVIRKNKNILSDFNNVLKCFFNRKILSSTIILFLYNIVMVYILYNLKFWNVWLLKDTFIWVFWSFSLILSLSKQYKEKWFLKNILLSTVKRVLLFEFIFNVYTFNIGVELILVPIITWLSLLSRFTGTKKEYKMVNTIFSYILSFFIIWYWFYIVGDFIKTPENLINSNNFYSFLLPILLTIFIIPLLYMYGLIMAYEGLFIRMSNCFRKNKKLYRIAKIKIIKYFWLNLNKLNIFAASNIWFQNDIEKKDDIDMMLKWY